MDNWMRCVARVAQAGIDPGTGQGAQRERGLLAPEFSEIRLPSGKLKSPFIVDLPIKNGDVPLLR